MKFQGMAVPSGVEATSPTLLLVFPIGKPPANDGRKWKFTREDLELVAANFKARPDPMPILYDHGSDPAKGSKAAGWVDSVEVRNEGLFAAVRWTAEARDEIRSGAWGFRSPGFEGEEDEEGFIRPRILSETSLVNLPAIGGMAPVTAGKKTIPPKAGGKGKSEMANDETVTAGKKKAAATSFDRGGILSLVRESMGIPDVIDDDTLAGLIGKSLEGEPEPDEMQPMPGAEAAPPAIAALSAKVDAQAKEIAELRTSKEIEATIEKGRADLVLTPALEEVARAVAAHGGIDALRNYVASQKPTAPAPGAVLAPGAPAREAPESRSPWDHVGRFAAAFDAERFGTHKAAVAFMDKAVAAGRKVSYREAIIATTRKSA